MKKRIHKLLSLMLTLILVVGMIPMTSLPAFAATTSVTGVDLTGGEYFYYSTGSKGYTIPVENVMAVSGSSKVDVDGFTKNGHLYSNEACTYRLTEEPVLDETYYFVLYFDLGDSTNNITDSNSTVTVDGFYNGEVVSATSTAEGEYTVICSVTYGELTGGVKAVASGVEYDSAEGGYAPTFTTLKAVSTTGKKLENTVVDGVSYYGAKSGCFYKTNSGTSFSDVLTTAPQVGETYYSYIRLDSINGNLNIEEDLVDIQIPGYKVEYLASYERDMGFTSMVVYKATKVPVCVGGVGMNDGDYLAVGASKTQTTKPSGGYAYYEDGKLTLNNYSYEGEGYLYYSSSKYAVIYSDNDLTLELIGNNTLNQTDSDSAMIYVNGAKLTVGGDGKLTGTAGARALYAYKGITINGGTVEVSTESTCILSYGEVIINDGDITAESENGTAIYTDYDVTVNGGNVTATGADQAISCSGFTVAKGLKIQASTTVDGALGEYVSANRDSYKKIVIAKPVYHSVYFCFGDSPVASQDIENGKCAIRPEDPYQEGKSFMGWYTKNGEEYDFETPVTGELYLYAKFGYDVYIWLDENDEYPVAGYTAEEGTIINEPAEPGQENKRFIGWYTDGGTKYDFSKPLTGHVNLYAKFECIHNYVSGKCEYCGEAAPVAIKAPANVKATIVASSGKPKITWDKVDGAVKYEVWRATTSTGKGSRMSSPTTTSLTNNSAKAGTKYYYYVLAVDKDGNKSEASKRVNITCDYAQPVVTITNDAATGKPKLTWNAVDGATSYKIYRATSKTGSYSLMKTQSGTSYINTSATVNKTYYYKVRAYGANSASTSVYSAVVSKLCDLKRPTVTLSNVASTGKIKVSRTKVDGAAKYQVQRATSKTGTYTTVKTTTSLSYTDTNTTAGKTYYYKVRAVHSNSNANSAYTAYKSRMCDLKAPVVSITTSSGKPKVSWAAITGAKEYKIYRSTSKTGTYKLVKTTTAKYWKDTTAVKGKTYYYKVVAVHKSSGANSAQSTVKSIKCTK